jgi:RNA polymerase sigma-70 factor (ECF subfamily)
MALGVGLPTDEALLIRDLKNGSARAYAVVLEKYGPRLLRTAQGMLGNTSDAEDVLQQTMLSMFKAIGSFRGDSALSTWLTRILFNQISRVRKMRATKSAVSLDGETILSPPAPGDAPAAIRARIDLAAMLRELSDEHRDILVLRELQGLSYREIADMLAVPQGTVESRLFRAREQLKRKFAGYEV